MPNVSFQQLKKLLCIFVFVANFFLLLSPPSVFLWDHRKMWTNWNLSDSCISLHENWNCVRLPWKPKCLRTANPSGTGEIRWEGGHGVSIRGSGRTSVIAQLEVSSCWKTTDEGSLSLQKTLVCVCVCPVCRLDSVCLCLHVLSTCLCRCMLGVSRSACGFYLAGQETTQPVGSQEIVGNWKSRWMCMSFQEKTVTAEMETGRTLILSVWRSCLFLLFSCSLQISHVICSLVSGSFSSALLCSPFRWLANATRRERSRCAVGQSLEWVDPWGHKRNSQ